MSDPHNLGMGSDSAHPEPVHTPERRKDDPRLRRSYAQLALQYAVASILAGAATIAEAMPRILETLCTHLQWDVAAYWGIDHERAVLRCDAYWQTPTADLRPFHARSRAITFAMGEGLPGRVWATGAPAVIPDLAQDANFPRGALAGGLHAAVAFPVSMGDVIHGVIECFGRGIGELDEVLVQALTTVGTQIGQFIARTRAEARRVAMLETALDAIVSMDHTGNIVEWNPEATRLFGYEQEQVLGRELASLIIPPELREGHRAGLARYLATGEGPLVGRRMEVTALRADGVRFPAEISITRVPIDGPPLFKGHIRDLSERRRMEAALRASEERLRMVVANAPVVLFAVDRDGIFTLSEGRGLAALGLHPGEHVGRSYFELYGHLADSVAAMRRVLAGEQATTINRYEGLVFETWWRPLRDADGTITGAIGVSADITERTRIEEQRQYLERRARAALDALLAMAEAVVEAPDDGVERGEAAPTIARRLASLAHDVLGSRSLTIVAISADDVLEPLACAGLSPEQQQQWYERIAHLPRTALSPAITARLRAGETVLVDTHRPGHQALQNPFGVERYLIAPMRVGQTLVGLLSVDYGPDTGEQDGSALIEGTARLGALVLERERLQREREEARGNALALTEANRRMDEFLGIAGHEMRTPLTSIKGNLQLAQRRLARLFAQDEARGIAPPGGVGELGQVLNRAEVQVGRLGRIVEDILDVSRIRAGRLEIRRQRCDLVEIVRERVDEQRALAPDREILLNEAEGPLIVDADAERIGQVVTNFLTNALKYAPAGQPIVAGVAREQAAARVWVRDEGPGLAPEEQGRVWELFYRAVGVEHRHGSSVGLGMGLHISRTIVEQHGGQVGVESAPGAGATFWFTLPLAP